MRFFQKAIKAAEIPVKYTEGFSPHQVLSFAFPLGVGMQSEAEYFDLELESMDGVKDYTHNLNREMCEGIAIEGFYLLPEKTPNAMASVQAASYKLTFTNETANSHLEEAVKKFVEAKEVLSEKETKTGIQTRNLKEAVYEISAKDNALYFMADASSGGNVKPQTLVNALFAPYMEPMDLWEIEIVRLEIFKKDENGKFVSLIDGLEKVSP
jgi:radical SAM-linked protein